MIETAIILAFVFAALLTSRGLCRAADRLARGKNQLPGTAFDASPLRPRLCSVRKDFVAELHHRAVDSPYHEELMESARHAVVRMAFFRTRAERGDSAEQIHAAQIHAA